MANIYLDTNVSLALAHRLTSLGHPTQTARGAGLEKALDPAHLLHAVRERRILITHDHDYRNLHDAWLLWADRWGVPHERHAGIVVTETMSAARLEPLLLALLNMGLPRENELYEWTRARGWVRRDDPSPPP